MKWDWGFPKIAPVSVNQRLPWQGFLFQFIYRLFFLTIFAFIFWAVGSALLTPHAELDASRMEVADLAVDRAVMALRNNAGEIRRVELLHFENDPSDYVTERLRKRLDDQGGFVLTKPRFADKLKRLFGFENQGFDSLGNAKKEAMSSGADAFIWGRVDRLENETGGSTFTGDYELFDLKNDRKAFSGKIAESTVPGKVFSGGAGGSAAVVPLIEIRGEGTGSLALLARRTPWHLRFLWFLIVMLLLPVFSISFIRYMVAKKSNRINAFTLGIYTVVDLIFAYFMIGGRFGSFVSVLIFILAGLCAFAYNVRLMTFAVKLEE